MSSNHTTWEDYWRNGRGLSTSSRTRLAKIDRHGHRSKLRGLGRCTSRMNAPIDHTSRSQGTEYDRREYCQSPVYRRAWVSRNSNFRSRRLFIPEPAKFDQLTGTFGTLQYMQIFWIGKIKLFWGVHPCFQGRMVDTAKALGIRVFFEVVLLKLLKKQHYRRRHPRKTIDSRPRNPSRSREVLVLIRSAPPGSMPLRKVAWRGASDKH